MSDNFPWRTKNKHVSINKVDTNQSLQLNSSLWGISFYTALSDKPVNKSKSMPFKSSTKLPFYYNLCLFCPLFRPLHKVESFYSSFYVYCKTCMQTELAVIKSDGDCIQFDVPP